MYLPLLIVLVMPFFGFSTVGAFAEEPLRIIAFGAHPDDCELAVGGCAIQWAKQGHKVKFVSTTNGDIGHSVIAGGPLAKRLS